MSEYSQLLPTVAQADDLGFGAIEPGRRRRPGHGGTLLRKLRQENHELKDLLNYIATPALKKEKEKNEEWFVSFLLALSTLMTICLAVASHRLLVQGLKRVSSKPCLQFSGHLEHSQPCFNCCVPMSADFPSVQLPISKAVRGPFGLSVSCLAFSHFP